MNGSNIPYANVAGDCKEMNKRDCQFTLASLQDIGYLNLKDSQFVEDVSRDITHFQEARDSYRVLVFPPFASYHRLLIHKVVESDFSNLITFSVGEQFHRRTVIAFVEACYRGEKGIQLLSQPKEDRTRQTKSSSKWRNLSSQERVANWVRLREVKNRKREIWNTPKLFNVSDLEQDDSDMSVENTIGEGGMDRTKPKKQAAAVYVPPFLRGKKGAGESQENVNNSQSSQFEKLSSHPEQNSGVVHTEEQDEPRSRGRGRGRRKPEIQVYVPKAIRESRQEVDTDIPSGLINQQEIQNSHGNEDVKNFVIEDQETKNMYDDYDEEDRDEHILHKSEQAIEVPSGEQCMADQEQYMSITDESVNTSMATDIPSVDSDDCVQNALNVDCSGANNDESNLTFEFYDPAVIAFLPSPKLPQEADLNISSNANFSNPFFSQGPSNQLQETNGLGSDSQNVHVIDKNVCSSDLTVPVSVDTSERADGMNISDDVSQRLEQDSSVNVLSDDVINSEKSKVSIENDNDDSVSSKKKSKSETKKKKTKKKRDEKSDSSAGELGKETKPKSKSKLRKSPPEEEEKEKSSALKQSLSPRVAAEKSADDGADNDDSWDALFDDDGDCLDDSVLADAGAKKQLLMSSTRTSFKKITAHVGKVEIDRPKIDYLNYTPKEPDENYEVFNHIIEIYNFPPEFGTHDIIGAFKDFLPQGFDIKWVDDTHALGVFSSTIAAREALKISHPMLKIRPMSEASRQGLNKAKSCQEFLQPYKERPQTTSMAARRLVAGALGVAPRMSKEMREQERNKLKAAKEKRKQEKQQKVDIWDGNFGKCAMDDV